VKECKHLRLALETWILDWKFLWKDDLSSFVKGIM
jgi:hypothetical protein